nr:hypothetical protein [Deltaproteobacteria bacterium]
MAPPRDGASAKEQLVQSRGRHRADRRDATATQRDRECVGEQQHQPLGQHLAGAVDHAHVLRGRLVADLLRLERLRADLHQRAVEVSGLLRAPAVVDRLQRVDQRLVPLLAARQLAVVAAAAGELDAATAIHAEAHRLQRLEHVLPAPAPEPVRLRSPEMR